MNKISHKSAQLLLTEAQFCAWIGQSAPGATIQYHCGFLAIDMVRASSNLPETDRKELVRVGRRAWWAFDQGLVHLVQRRLGTDRFAYLAIARARPKKMQASLLRVLAQHEETGGLANPNNSLRRFRS
ncbi:hypothetical protein [Chelativorans sp. Marseille-P2723]|uniref:hypothetical protein n=1 Tax=Chelativorans sp. Marseille-P2723 TaxID=2709133 RepID=UPI0015703F64|nr:hypothetical protein [Chelativorans sp. Marseille-P2723]